MIRIERRNEILRNKEMDERRIIIKKIIKKKIKKKGNGRREMKDIIGKKERGIRIDRGNLKFKRNIKEKILKGIEIGIDIIERIKKCGKSILKKGKVDVMIEGEIIEEVRIGNERILGDMIYSGEEK